MLLKERGHETVVAFLPQFRVGNAYEVGIQIILFDKILIIPVISISPSA